MATGRALFGLVNAGEDENGARVPGAKAYFYNTGTAVQLPVYSDTLLTDVWAQPVIADADGVFPTVYFTSGTAYRCLMTDDDDVALPGYPIDDLVPIPMDASEAASISFSPTEDIPETNVQDAIEATAALVTDQLDIVYRALQPWDTGGTSDDYTITPSPAITEYDTNNTFIIRPDRDNTGAVTLNVNGCGNVYWKRVNHSGALSAFAAGEIVRGTEHMVHFDGTGFLTVFDKGLIGIISSADGVSYRFRNGLQICMQTASVSAAISTAFMGGFRSGTQTWTFPGDFTSTPKVSVTATGLTALGAVTSALNLTNVTYCYTAASSQASATRTASLMAVGQWL